MGDQYRLDAVKELAIFSWVSSKLGITVIWDKQKAKADDKPALPYAALNFLSGGGKEGDPEEIYKELDTFTYPMRKVITLEVQIFAENGHLAYGETLVNSLALPTVRDSLRSAGLVVRDCSDVMDISKLLDTKFEFRASVDVFLAYETDVIDAPGEIRKVTISQGTLSADGIVGTVIIGENTIDIS